DSDPRLWKFAALGDPQVEILLFRQPNAQVLLREVTAVKEWMNSGFALHTMRDHPTHNWTVVPNLWAVRANTDKTSPESINSPASLADLREELYRNFMGNYRPFNDQLLLTEVIWPILQVSVMQHDSLHCKQFYGSRPFPTERTFGHWVGCPAHGYVETFKWVCPKECRPPKHEDWIYC
ncbi:unnamed protein product, partial [Meganyctiphanes norvegica]